MGQTVVLVAAVEEVQAQVAVVEQVVLGPATSTVSNGVIGA